jgi:hypothetical protein
MKNHTLLLCIVCSLLITTWSCKSDKTEAQTTPEVAAPAAPAAPSYPPLGNQVVSQLYADADKVDIIFYNLPISVNQEDPASVKNTVLYVAPASPNITATCQPLGRLTWMAKGSIIKEADIYCEEGCQYLLFIENNKPVAANALQQAGVDFFKNIISQVEKQKNGQ